MTPQKRRQSNKQKRQKKKKGKKGPRERDRERERSEQAINQICRIMETVIENSEVITTQFLNTLREKRHNPGPQE